MDDSVTQEEVFKIVNPFLKCKLYNTKSDIDCYLSLVETSSEQYLSLDRDEIVDANRSILLNAVLEDKEISKLESDLISKAINYNNLQKVRSNLKLLRANLAYLEVVFNQYKEAKDSQISAFERVVNELEDRLK